eukprot:2158149-Alexandrium_andersonii.AAC.1
MRHHALLDASGDLTPSAAPTLRDSFEGQQIKARLRAEKQACAARPTRRLQGLGSLQGTSDASNP